MEPEQEALRLSCVIALCVSGYLAAMSIDNFQQSQVPGTVGQADSTWWRTHSGGCDVYDRAQKRWSLHEVGRGTGARFIRL